MIQFQSASVFSQVGPQAPATPALLQTMCTAPNAFSVCWASFSSSSGFETSVSTPRTSTPFSRNSASACRSALFFDVGEHDLHAFRAEALGHARARCRTRRR